MQTKIKNKKPSQSRRRFLKNTGGIALLIGGAGILPQFISCKNPKEVETAIRENAVNAWIQLTKDGNVTIYSPATEMGQGSMTALPIIIAEEMDADWDKVKVEFAPQDANLYGRKLKFKGQSMMTFGSTGVMSYFSILRQAGAQARYVLLNSAAKHWGVDIKELTTQPSKIIHKDSKREMTYGEVVSYLEIPNNIPTIAEGQLKNPKDFRLIGKDIPRKDIPHKVNGTAQFAMDVKLPDMLYGMMERGRLHGAKPTLKNEAEIKAMDEVVGVYTLDHGIGFITEKMDHAFRTKYKLDIEWSDSKASGYNSADTFGIYEKILAEGTEGKVMHNDGDIANAKSKAANEYIFDYKNDYIYHAQQEPLNAVARVAEDGSSVEVWIGTQDGVGTRDDVAKALGIDPSKVTVHQQYLGGGFGRRTLSDYGVEAALLAKEVAPKPVKLLWAREDDLQYGMYRPASLQRMKAYTDSKGNLTGFSHDVVGDGTRLIADGSDINGYKIPNHKVEMHIVPQGIRVKHWRSVGHGTNKFAIECMMDELAAKQNTDPVEFRKRMLEPKPLATLEKVAAMANWGKSLPKGHAQGVAFLERSRTFSSGICEISLNRKTGKIKVHHFWSAHDAGIVIQPDSVMAQIEGGIVMGLSSVFNEQITIVNGEVQQNNFNDYPIIRMHELPESIETELLTTMTPPAGLGESSTPLVACAVANAFFALTGKRLRHLPFTPERVLEALAE